MFGTPSPPEIEPDELLQALIKRLIPPAQWSNDVMRFAALALTLRFFSSKIQGRQNDLRKWQNDSLDSVGCSYSKLLITHYYFDANADSTASFINDAAHKTEALFDQAEKHMQLVQSVAVPPNSDLDLVSIIRTCHARLLGALALTLPYGELRKFFSSHYTRTPLPLTAGMSHKTVLQEFSQGKHLGVPAYRVVQESGPGHAKVFEVQVRVKNYPDATASGGSKKEAEELAAEKWLKSHARAYLEERTLQNAYHRKLSVKANSLDSEILRNESISALKFFGLPDNCAVLVRRAMTHPSLRLIKRLPEYEDNRALAVFGNLILHAGFGHYLSSQFFTSTEFAARRHSIALYAGKAISSEALNPFVEALEIRKNVKSGPSTDIATLSAEQRVSFLKSLIAVRFLAQAPNFDIGNSIGKMVLDHFAQTSLGVEGTDALKTSLTKLLEFSGSQQIRAVSEDSIQNGSAHKPELVAKIRFSSESPICFLTVSGGRGPSSKAARESLAEKLLPVVKAIHCDFELARQLAPPDLVEKLAGLYLPSAFANAPQSPRDAQKWLNQGLLGTNHLRTGEFAKFSSWAASAFRFLPVSNEPEKQQEARVLGFYGMVRAPVVWDMHSIIQKTVSLAREFADSSDALADVTNLKRQPFYLQMQELLGVFSLAAKAGVEHTTMREVFEGLSLLRRRDFALVFTLEGADLIIEERQGSMLNLCSLVLDAIGVSNSRPNVDVSVAVNSDGANAVVRISGGKNDGDTLETDNKLKSSILVNYLRAESVVNEMKFEGGVVTFVVHYRRNGGLAEKILSKVASPFATLDGTTRSALSKTLHDLKNHLVAAQIAMSVLPTERTLRFRAQAEASEHLDAARRLSDQFSVLAGVLTEPKIERISLHTFFRGVMSKLLNSLPPEIHVNLPHIAGEHYVWSSSQFLESIVINLIQNSIEAMNSRGSITLGCRSVSGSGDFVFTLRDSGPGITDDLLGKLLAGVTVTSSKVNGSGVGMSTVVAMLRQIGGTISGENLADGGFEWSILIASLSSSESEQDNFTPSQPNV